MLNVKATTKKKEGKLVAIASTETEDRSGEVVKMGGWELDNFKANPVLQFAHRYDTPPIGIAKNIRVEDGKLVFEPMFHEITEAAREIKKMFEADPPIMRAWSVGFIPKDYDSKNDRVITKQELLEISAVPVPANAEALTLQKGISDDKKKEVCKWVNGHIQCSIKEKGAIPYSVHGDGAKAPEDDDWNAGEEVKKATGDGDKLKKMHAWVDSEAEGFDEDERKWYKLPHHRGSGSQAVVWKGVAAAMGALLGARGGVDLPSKDRKGVYDHLKKHYKQFDKDAPEFKQYTCNELNNMIDKGIIMIEEEKFDESEMFIDLKPYENEHSCRLQSPDKYKKFARKNCYAKSDGKCIDFIFGIKEDGKSEVQSMRYNKDEWTEAEAKKHCDKHGGTFEAAKKEKRWIRKERWNKSLSKAFDFDKVDDNPSSFEYKLYIDFLECKIKDIFINSFTIPSPLLGSYLSSFKEITKEFSLLDTRNFLWDGRESPPIYEVIKLNSKKSDDFLIKGVNFYELKDKDISLAVKYEPTFFGLEVSIITTNKHREWNKELLEKAHNWVKENNYLKGEKFALNGEFLPKTDVKWDDVILKEEIKNPIKFAVKGLTEQRDKMKSRGIMFIGKPGNGKTYAGKAIMDNTDSTFIWVSSNDFKKLNTVEALGLAFKLARDLAPSVLFIEDIDSWLRDYTVDLLKTELDGIRENKGMVTILTSNFPEKMPDALIDRPGRFHDILEFEYPNKDARKEMIKKWAGEMNEEEMKDIIKETEGFSGAYLRELVDFAKMIAEDEGIKMNEAMRKSLEKIKKQRELIDSLKKEEIKEKIKSLQEEMAEFKEGRVLSKKNRELVKNIMSLTKQLASALQTLLDAGSTRDDLIDDASKDTASGGEGKPKSKVAEVAQAITKDEKMAVRALQKTSGEISQILNKIKKNRKWTKKT